MGAGGGLSGDETRPLECPRCRRGRRPDRKGQRRWRLRRGTGGSGGEFEAPRNLVAFWDVDAPATLDRVHLNPADPFGALIPRYDVVFTYGGGPPVVSAYQALGARQCVPIYNGLDPETHHPAEHDARFAGDLGFLGNRLPDREARVEEFFLRPAARLPRMQFLLGGAGWGDKPRSSQRTLFRSRVHAGPQCLQLHSRAVLNISARAWRGTDILRPRACSRPPAQEHA